MKKKTNTKTKGRIPADMMHELEDLRRAQQIETSLEKVRARSMAMKKSDELGEVASVMFNEMSLLGGDLFAFGIVLCDKHENMVEQWHSIGEAGMLTPFLVPIDLDYIHRYRYDQWKAGVEVFSIEIPEEYIAEHFDLMYALPTVQAVMEDMQERGVEVVTPTWEIDYGASFRYGYLLVSSLKPFEEEHIFPRFAKVFEQAYTRFLDLQKAEAQVREAQIEAALERIRAQSMLIRHSDEIINISDVFHQQLLQLNIPSEFSYVWLPDEEKNDHQFWASWAEDENGDVIFKNKQVTYPLDRSEPYTAACFTAWESPETVNIAFIPPDEISTFFSTWHELLEGAKNLKAGFFQDGIYYAEAYMKYGCFGINIRRELSTEEEQILKRFSIEFERAYTRFLDLKKAEAQAREAQIEVALERVRAKAMAMHQSEDIFSVVATLRDQMEDLQIPGLAATTIYLKQGNGKVRAWDLTDLKETETGLSFRLDFEYALDDNIASWFHKMWQQEEPYFIVEGSKEEWYESAEWFRQFDEEYADSTIKYIESAHQGKTWHAMVPLTHGRLVLDFLQPPPAEVEKILVKMGIAFDMSYQRFLDLQKAEKQAREAEIEAALERIRSRTMGMQHSDELAEVAHLLNKEVRALGTKTWGCAFNIYGENESTEWFGTEAGLMPPYKTPREKIFLRYYEKGQAGEKLYIEEFAGEKQIAHYDYLCTLPVLGDMLKDIRAAGHEFPAFQIDHVAYFKYGYLLFITLEPAPRDHNIYIRFAKVFQQTYTRFLDLKQAEAQAREAEIEAALERVRARSMAMQKSDELREVIQLVYDQFVQLDIFVEHTGFIMDVNERDDMHIWLADRNGAPSEVFIPYFDSPHWNSFIEAREKGEDFFTNHLSFAEKNKFYKKLFKFIPELPEEAKEYYFNCPGLAISTVLQENVGLYIENFSGTPYSTEENDTLMRFGRAFQQAYTRFSDLQKAEAQAREAKIEAALERVRARTMGMHHSSELPEAANLLFGQVQALGMPAWSAGYCIWNENKDAITAWMSSEGVLQPPFVAPLTEDTLFMEMREGHLRGDDFVVIDMGGEDLVKHYEYMRTLPVVGQILDDIIAAGFPLPTYQIMHYAYFSHGLLLFITYEPVPEAHDIFKRFAKVFDQTYTRFLDLKKAEAQAREAEIEGALERVRSRSLAMHNSEELQEVVQTVFEQIHSLGVEADAVEIQIYEDDSRDLNLWVGTADSDYAECIHLPYYRNKFVTSIFEHRQQGVAFAEDRFSKGVKDRFTAYFFKHYKGVPRSRRKYLTNAKQVVRSMTFAEHTSLMMLNYSNQTFSEQDNEILQRFGKVFEQSYTRFLDLKRSEAQAREVQIEVALERVRARTMAMHSGDELADTAMVLFDQLVELGFRMRSCGFLIMDEETQTMEDWSANIDELGKGEILTGTLSFDQHPVLAQVVKTWREGKPYYVGGIQDEMELQKYYGMVTSQESVSDHVKGKVLTEIKSEWTNSFYFGFGMMYVLTPEPITDDEIEIMLRFASVFKGTYTRFLDLKRAEAQARESQIQLALERVRAQTMAMHHSEELAGVSFELFQQAQSLGVATWHCAFNIYNEEENNSTEWGSNAGGTYPEYTTPRVGIFKKYYEIGQTGKALHVEVIGEDRCADHYAWLCTLPGVGEQLVKLRESGVEFPTSQIDHVAYFKYGYLIFITYEPAPEAHEIFKRFANAFEQTYTRFLDLQKAEAQAREAQIEAALEKVRSRSLAMHKAEELGEVATVVFDRLKELNMPVDDGVAIVTHIEGSRDQVEWMESPGYPSAIKFYQPYHEHPVLADYWKAKNEGLDFIAPTYTAEESKSFFEHIFEFTDYRHTPQEIKDYCLAAETYSYFAAFQKNSSIFINDFSGRSLSEEEIDIVKRFSKVFEQAYIRFLDLERAEVQAREAQIETALERVRARTMAMHHSDELPEIANVLYSEIQALGIPAWSAGYNILSEDKESTTCIMSSEGQLQPSFHLPLTGERSFRQWHKAIKRGDEFFVQELGGKELEEHYAFLLTLPGVQQAVEPLEKAGISLPTYQINHLSFFQHGFLLFITYERVPDAHDIFKRFTRAFEQTYTRFIDLKTAEAQAREAQIEASLERVRARTMAMHHSDELGDVAVLLYREFQSLGVTEFFNCGYVEVDEENKVQPIWVTDPDGEEMREDMLPLVGDQVFDARYKAWKKQVPLFHQKVGGTKLRKHIEFASPHFDEEMRKMVASRFPDTVIFYCANFPHGYLHILSQTPLTEEEESLLVRYTKVFEMSYNRFLDLKKAESQTREAQIEAALERVRARTMAMHQSDELGDVVSVLDEQVRLLQLAIWGVNITIFKEEESMAEVWLSESPESLAQQSLKVHGKKDPVVAREWQLWKDQVPSGHISLKGKKKKEHDEYLFEQTDFKLLPPDMKDAMRGSDEVHFSLVPFRYGLLNAIDVERPLDDEDMEILKRFAQVFEQAYTRFLDLKRAEAQARESQIETALERVRSRAMAMQHSDELGELVNKVFEELTQLEMALTRCLIWIIDPEDYSARWWMANPESESSAMSYHVPYHEHPAYLAYLEAWKNREQRWVYDLSGENKKSWDKILFSETGLVNLPQGVIDAMKAPDRVLLTATFNPFGALQTAGLEPLSEENTDILERFGKVFDLTYTRFHDLQRAEHQTRQAQIEVALERVRARALAMQQPEELVEVAEVMRQEMGALGLETLETSTIFIYDAGKKSAETWFAIRDDSKPERPLVSDHITVELEKTWVGREMVKFYKSKKDRESIPMRGAHRAEWINYAYDLSAEFDGFFGEDIPDRIYHLRKFSHGAIGAAGEGDLSGESWDLLARAASAFSLAYSRFQDLTQARTDLQLLKEEKKRAEDALSELKATQNIHAEKMASLGQLTAGIAHEIQNPLNFVNNFSDLNEELIQELGEEIEKGDIEEAKAIAADIIENEKKIKHHGKRAEAIVRSMLQHSRATSSERLPTDINALADEYLRLAYHGMRAKDKSFNVEMKTEWDESLKPIEIVQQEIGRVLLNLITNAFYAIHEKAGKAKEGYAPTVWVSSSNGKDSITISVKDNADGMPQHVLDKIFQPFFTTKPTGEGTGLGLSLSYDIIKAHGGELKVETKEGEGSEFIVQLPRNQ
jgi:signal transduction histidine kinase